MIRNLNSITYTPDGNFSGSDYFEISVAEEFDEFAYDIIRVSLNINPIPDIPKFGSMPYPGVVLGKPWYFEVHGLDGDLNDHLTLTTANNLPGWLRLDQTSKRTWSFRDFNFIMKMFISLFFFQILIPQLSNHLISMLLNL